MPVRCVCTRRLDQPERSAARGRETRSAVCLMGHRLPPPADSHKSSHH